MIERATKKELTERVRRVLGLHKPVDRPDETAFCAECGYDWPCQTVRLLAYKEFLADLSCQGLTC